MPPIFLSSFLWRVRMLWFSVRGCRLGCVRVKVFLSLCLCVGTAAGRQQRVVTFSQASGTFIAVAIINSVPTETSFGWAGQYLSLRVWAMAHTLLLSSYSRLTLSAPLLPCHLMHLRSVMFAQFKESCVLCKLISNWANEIFFFFFFARVVVLMGKFCPIWL